MGRTLLNVNRQPIVLTGAGAKPTVPNPPTAVPTDSGWLATDIMKGEIAWNATDNVFYYRTDGDVITVFGGGGDMYIAVYDPTAVVGDAFDMDNMAEGTNLILTAAERAKIAHLTVTEAVNLDNAKKQAVQIACSDETTDLTTGTAKATFRMPFAFTITAVRASVTTAPVGSTIIVDINEGGSTILSTKLTIDDGENTSTTAATPPVISDASLVDDAEITVDIDQIGSGTAGAGLKVSLIGYAT